MMSLQEAEHFCQTWVSQMGITSDPDKDISLALEELRHKTQKTAWKLHLAQKCHQEYVRQTQLRQMSGGERFLWQAEFGLVNANLLDLIYQHQRTLDELSEFQKQILDTELIRWKRGQQLAGNGVHFENSLNKIQGWCQSLADIIWENRQQITQMEILCAQAQFNIPAEKMSKVLLLKSQINILLSTLIASTFIIEEQPPQVLKTNTRFSATVRLLLGSKSGAFMTHPNVEVKIINEAQARALLKNDNVGPREVSGDIANNLRKMEYDEVSRKLSASFRNMKLTKIKRKKNNTGSVMDEKFSLLFQSQLKVGDELIFQVCALSLPVVIVHSNQEPRASATITWDNAFAAPGRIPFQVPEKVPWKEMGEVLSAKFKAATGRGLTPDDLQFLLCKVFRSAQIHDNSLCITWSQFCKESLPGCSFTFWEWFYAIMETTRGHLQNLWNDGLILGFIAQQQAEDMLLTRCKRTFLLRFSDSILGGITIAWVTDSLQRGRLDVIVLEPPFTSREFEIRNLADIINDLKCLHFLYPHVSKDQAFGKYYTAYTENQPPHCNRSVKWNFAMQITGYRCAYNSYPGTPQSIVQSSGSEYCHSQNSTDMEVGSHYPEVENLLTYNLFKMVEPHDNANINVNDLVLYSRCS